MGATVVDMDDDAIRALLSRLARPHQSGGQVVERSALMAAGADLADVVEWITAHAGTPETAVASDSGLGLHGRRITDGGGGRTTMPNRYVLPAGELS
jgi:hypothetical protein